MDFIEKAREVVFHQLLPLRLAFLIPLVMDLETGSMSNFLINHLPFLIMLVIYPQLLNLKGIELTKLQHLIITVGLAIHPAGAVYSFYADVWFYDSLAHLYASAVLSSGFSILLWNRDYSRRKVLVYSFLFVLIGGTMWEVFERMTDALTVYGPVDTVTDYIFNFAGWILALAVGKKRLKNLGDY
jgi:hypothetical protein